MKILITGRQGQVSLALQRTLADHSLVVLGSDQLDLRQTEHIAQAVRQHQPDLIINPAAYTAVDLAESEPEKAFAINTHAPQVLAEEAARLGIPLIHYSTDYVFSGTKPTPYQEHDPCAPLGVYGQSKLAGEQAIRTTGCKHLILRTSWVYSLTGKNFLLTMQRLLQEREELRVVADQFGAPTWAGSIAHVTAQLINHWQADQAGSWGTFHLSGQGSTSWFGFAQAIAQHLQTQGKRCAALLPIGTEDYPTPAKRPANSQLDCSLLQQQWQVDLPHWQQALLDCLAEQ